MNAVPATKQFSRSERAYKKIRTNKERSRKEFRTHKQKKPEGTQYVHIFLRNTLCAMPATPQPKSAKLHHNQPKERIWKKHLISKKN